MQANRTLNNLGTFSNYTNNLIPTSFSAHRIWARVGVVFIIFWLLFGDLWQLGAASYNTTLLQIAASLRATQSQTQAITSPNQVAATVDASKPNPTAPYVADQETLAVNNSYSALMLSSSSPSIYPGLTTVYIGGTFPGVGGTAAGHQLTSAPPAANATWENTSNALTGQVSQLFAADDGSLLARTIYGTQPSGALWRSTDGLNWAYTGNVATRFVKAKNGSIFMLGGSSAQYIYRSDDNGVTFNQITTYNGRIHWSDCSFTDYSGLYLSVSPVDPNIIWAVAANGKPEYCDGKKTSFFISTDGGKNFSKVDTIRYSVGGIADQPNGYIDLYPNPIDANSVFALYVNGGSGGLYRIDGLGSSVVSLGSFFWEFNTAEPHQMIATDAKTNTLWVAGFNQGYVYKGTLNGTSLTPISVTATDANGVSHTMNNPLSVAVADDGTVWVGGTGNTPDLASSTDGGATWVDQSGNIASALNGLPSITSILTPQLLTAKQRTPTNNIGKCDITGHPVCPATGDFFESFSDLSLMPASGSALPLELTRSYNSVDPSAGLFGKGWHSTYDMKLAADASGVVTVTQANGRQDDYSPKGDGINYYAPAGANATLIKGSSFYTLTAASQITYTFDATSGNLTKITDRNSNQITLTYNTGGYLTQANDNYGRQLTFTPTSNGRTSAVSDGTRTVYYYYDASYTYLTRVTDVRGNNTAYTYDAGGRLNNWYDPDNNGVANNLVLQNTYDSNGRVLTQTLYPASGTAYTATWDYTSQPGKTIYTDYRGKQSIYTIESFSLLPISVQDAGGGVRSVLRNYNDDPVWITDTNGTLIRVGATSQGRLLSLAANVTVDGSNQLIYPQVSYNQANDPVALTDGRRNNTLFHYTANGNLDSTTNALNQTTNYTYDSQGRITHAASIGGLAVDFGYDALGHTTDITETYTTLVGSSTTPTSKSYHTEYQYNAQGWPTFQSDRYDVNSRPSPLPGITYQYDPAGHVLTTTNQIGQQATNHYDAKGDLLSSTNFLGQQTTYSYDWQHRLTQTVQILASGNLTTTYTYDENGNQRTMTDPRLVTTTYDYDAVGRLITTTVPLQTGGSMLTVNTYSVSGNLTATTRLDTGFSGSQVTCYDYDELRRLIKTTQDCGTGGSNLNYQTVTIYDQNGNTIETRQSKGSGPAVNNWLDPSQVITSVVHYDVLNRLIDSTVNAWKDSVSGDKVLTTSYTYDDVQNIVTTTLPYGNSSAVQNDAVGRTISTTLTPANPASGAITETTYNFYDPRGLLIRTIDPLSNWQDMSYDALARLSSLTQYTGANGTGTALTSNTYYIDQAQPKTISVGPAPYYTRQDAQMDEAGRLITSTVYTGAPVAYPSVPGGALTTLYSYDKQGNRTSVTDPTGHITLFGYENTGWLRWVTQTVTSQGNLQNLYTSYNYSPLGNLVSVYLPGASQALQYSYDRLNRRSTETDQVGNVWQTYYDGLNRVTSRTSTINQSSYSYDNASRLLQVSSSGGTGGNVVTSYEYDKTSQPLTMTDQIGGNPSTKTLYGYDGLSRVISVTNPQGLVQYGYDKLNRRTSLQFGPSSSQKQVSYTYDGLSRPVTITNWLSQNLVYSYNGTRLNSLSYPNGVLASYSFDGAERLTAITQTNGASTIFSATYTLDNLSNRTTIAENLNGTGRNVTYNYDELSRLIQETRPGAGSVPVTTTYAYDIRSNITRTNTYLPPNTKSGVGTLVLTTTYSYNQADQLTSRSEVGPTGGNINGYTYNYNYDANGSLITETNAIAGGEVISYTYDARNRLNGVQRLKGSAALSSASFGYDGANTRTQMSYGGKTTTYLQDAAGGLPVVLQETVSGAVTPTNFLYPLGSTSPLFQTDSNSSPLWYHSDGLGSVRALTGASGSVVNTNSYSAFGLNVGESGKAANDHLFAGEQLDPTGLYFNRARFYSPSLGRFISRDNYAGNNGNPLSENRYSYGWDNPTNQTDPSGNNPIVGVAPVLCAIPGVDFICAVVIPIGIVIGVGYVIGCVVGIFCNSPIPDAICKIVGTDTGSGTSTDIGTNTGDRKGGPSPTPGKPFPWLPNTGGTPTPGTNPSTPTPAPTPDPTPITLPTPTSAPSPTPSPAPQPAPGGAAGGHGPTPSPTPRVREYNITSYGTQPSPRAPFEAHHIIQNEWAVNNASALSIKYGKYAAPSILLSETTHDFINNRQNKRRDARVAAGLGKWSSTLRQEFEYTESDMIAAGIPQDVIDKALAAASKYFNFPYP